MGRCILNALSEEQDLKGETVILESINKDYKPKTFKYADFQFIYPAVDMMRKIRR
jgi:hypothetical protein